MKNEAIIIYRCNGYRIAYEPNREYRVTLTKQEGRITTTKTYPVDFRTYLEDLHMGLEILNQNLKPVLKFLKKNGNNPTKEMVSDLEQLL